MKAYLAYGIRLAVGFVITNENNTVVIMGDAVLVQQFSAYFTLQGSKSEIIITVSMEDELNTPIANMTVAVK